MEPTDATDSSPRPPNDGVRLGDYAERWLESLPARLRPRTVKSYRELYRLHVAPTLKEIGLADLRRAQVKALLLDKQRQGLSRNTVRLIGACLSALCSEAIDDGLLAASPAVALGRWLGARGDPARRERTIRPFTPEQLARLLATARELCPRYYPLFLTLARTGCRPGEALALRWIDVNFQSREILIERALSAGRIGATKTGRSRRADMSRELASVLDRLRKETRAPAGWIFLSREGGLINEDSEAFLAACMPAIATILLTFWRDQPGLSGMKWDGPRDWLRAIPLHPSLSSLIQPDQTIRRVTPRPHNTPAARSISRL